MHIHVLCYIKSFHGCFMQICMLVMPRMSDAMFLVNMLCLEKMDCPVFVLLLTKLDDPVSQTGLSSFGRQIICFSCFNFHEPLVICIT
jgi:hypothetical protein